VTDPDGIWESAEHALIAGDAAALDLLLRENEAMFREERPPSHSSGGLAPDYSESDARLIIPRNHHFRNWAKFQQFVEAKKSDSDVAEFETAVDAIVAGDEGVLAMLLHEEPGLIEARSMRSHRSTLLHYVGSNGVEYFRQRTPPNIVRIAEVLLNAGAEVDAVADMYGGSTTLGLVATSIHPYLAGVLEPLLELLLKRGAAPDSPMASPTGGSTVNACLANGRQKGAGLMAAHGARIDLEGAAGLGLLDVVKSYFNEDGSLKESATHIQMKDGFAWACEFGRTQVVEFLLDRGMEVNASLKHHGQTGLHWAAAGGHADIVKLLLERHATVDARDESWKVTPLAWAISGWRNGAAGNRYCDVAALLVAAGAQVEPEWLASEKIRADPGMLAALSGKAGG
jgi:hypothetical protein